MRLRKRGQITETLRLTPGETVTILRSSPELLEVEGTWAPEGKPPPAHYHPAQEEVFEVIAGRLSTRIDGERLDLEAGETVEIPHETSHQIWNSGDVPTRARWQTRPAGRTEQWFRSIDALHTEGRVGRNGMPGPLAFGAYLSEFDDVFRLSVGPEPLTRPLISVLGVLGRARGYHPDPSRT
jgi:mannose-6-phosphate isomerase-like protein (cupin superfamily)